MSGAHFRNECKHGTLAEQCRCMGPKTVRIVPCPMQCPFGKQPTTPRVGQPVSHDPHTNPDLFRPVCDVHYWEAVDRHEDLYRCRYCRATWSLDDPPDGDAA